MKVTCYCLNTVSQDLKICVIQWTEKWFTVLRYLQLETWFLEVKIQLCGKMFRYQAWIWDDFNTLPTYKIHRKEQVISQIRRSDINGWNQKITCLTFISSWSAEKYSHTCFCYSKQEGSTCCTLNKLIFLVDRMDCSFQK